MFIDAHQYPLVIRKISARAGYLFKEASALIKQYDCDSVISFASGYSMLGFVVAQSAKKDIHVIDSDLPDILSDRQARLRRLSNHPGLNNAHFTIEHIPLDIAAADDNLKFTDVFHQCKRPVVILEGISYFLSQETRNWLCQALKQWTNACILFEYWPENGITLSAKLKQSIERNLSQSFRETLASYMPDHVINDFKTHYFAKDVSIGETENQLAKQAGEPPQLLDPNDYYPIKILTGVPREWGKPKWFD